MEKIGQFLRDRSDAGLLRRLRPAGFRRFGRIYFAGKSYLDLSSNDYLGLSGHPKLIAAAKEAIDTYGVGSSASRLLSGDLELTHRLERETAKFKGKESALIFNSGYQANIGILTALLDEHDAIFSDKLNHASIIDGFVLSGARIFRFKHNDAGHLESLLHRQRGRFKNALIVTETIFSMDGDRPYLRSLVNLKERFGCKIMVDEAHATGIFGANGSGVVREEGLTDKIEYIMGTFGKALGSFGAYLAASGETIEYMVNRSRGFIYSTALPPSVIAANLASLEIIREEPRRRYELLKKAEYLRSELIKKGFEVTGSSQIVPVIIGESEDAERKAESLREKGYWVIPIKPPTVPEGASRIRLSVTFDHDTKILERLVNDIV